MTVLAVDTPSYQFGFRPATTLVGRTMAAVPDVVKAMNSYFQGGLSHSDMSGSAVGKVNPEQEALEFYLFNHAIAQIRAKYQPFDSMGDDLPLVDRYHKDLAAKSCRMFYYLLLICTRESRHEKSGGESKVWCTLKNDYGNLPYEFFLTIRGKGSSQAAEIFRKDPPPVTLGVYTSYLYDLFYHGSFSGGYGGKAWAAVAKVLRDYVHGTISAEVMMDTAFTLCHNNGPIFNKGMLFDGYSDRIYTILDVQRSGQIPQYINELGFTESGYITTHFKGAVKLAQDLDDHLKGQFFNNSFVDWVKVEALGSLKNYPSKKKEQHDLQMKAIKAGYLKGAQGKTPVGLLNKDGKPAQWGDQIINPKPTTVKKTFKAKNPSITNYPKDFEKPLKYSDSDPDTAQSPVGYDEWQKNKDKIIAKIHSNPEVEANTPVLVFGSQYLMMAEVNDE